jgi:hypothetical protein
MLTKSKHEKIILNNNLPTLHVDSFYLYSREDGKYFIRFVVATPDGEVEQTRIMIAEEDLKELINTLCDISEYYPIKPKKSKNIGLDKHNENIKENN